LNEGCPLASASDAHGINAGSRSTRTSALEFWKCFMDETFHTTSRLLIWQVVTHLIAQDKAPRASSTVKSRDQQLLRSFLIFQRARRILFFSCLYSRSLTVHAVSVISLPEALAHAVQFGELETRTEFQTYVAPCSSHISVRWDFDPDTSVHRLHSSESFQLHSIFKTSHK
jgi:hypothetical protein